MKLKTVKLKTVLLSIVYVQPDGKRPYIAWTPEVVETALAARRRISRAHGFRNGGANECGNIANHCRCRGSDLLRNVRLGDPQ